MSTTATRYPGDCDEAYPEVFTVPPPQPTEAKPGQLTKAQVDHFFDKGYLIVDKFFSKEELDPCRKAIEKQVEDLAQKLYKGGKIKNLYQDKGLFERLSFIEKEFPGANVILHKAGILPPEFRAVWSNDRLLNLVEQLVGPNIAGHPVWNLRTKTPQNNASTVPWHQDCGYLDNESYKVLQPTAWIPLLDATAQNGCMEVVTGGHRPGRICRHTCCWADTWYVELPEEEMVKTLGVDLDKDIKLCPIPYGGMLLINNMIPHRSLPNLSNVIRWSMDLRWQDSSKPVGFYGLKEGLLMRDPSKPNHKIDWSPFVAVDRSVTSKQACNKGEKEDEFDTTIQGPHMMKWEMIHQNRHTAKVDKGKPFSNWHKA
ncbi:phytanoyl-CoA dioxygenase domain-containing protein 1-like [Haliotis rufescens]|uniref:phytanoyl-CoA dioxygenase domain-containing protein 1-like n=1 Tax=Haliotis rufescens TaxID=6454 RepID=UPI00201F9561|nr:phytanoyl-CoA dioxygenase domain-containing protein 1-like [Haliotis rufescens]